MNEFAQPISQQALDRMVDGDLTDDEQKMLLSQIDESPGDWQRLALTYVEAQVWQSTFRQTVSTADVAHVPEMPPDPAARKSPGITLAGLAVAVGLLISGFGIGIWVNKPAGTDRESESVAIDNSAREPVSGDSMPIAPEEREARLVTSPSNIQFVLHDGQSDEAKVLNVPVHDTSVPLDEVFSTNVPSVPEHVREMLRQTGHEVVEERGFLPVALPDGRQVVFPVNHVRVRNGARIYQ